jgi:NAD(P)H-nitrite reductase large subunit
MYLREENHHERLNIKLLSGKRATKLQADRREILVDNDSIPYDRLFLGCGGTPFVPPGMEGLDQFPGQVFTFLKFADAEKLAELSRKANHVVILGAGLIGMQAAEAFALLHKKVTVVELADYVLPMVSDQIAGRMIQTIMEREGVTFCLSDSVSQLAGQKGKLTEVHLKSGKTIPADLFVIAVGVRPNVGWLKDSGVTIDRGIVIDNHARTSIPDVYAGGDCAQGQELISGSRMVLATIPIAAELGTVAGYNMAGIKAEYRGGIPLNALQFGPAQIISYGYVKEKEGQEVISVLDEKNCIYKKILLEDNRLTGALFLRAIDRVGIFRYLIEEKIDVGAFKHQLLAQDFGPAALPMQVRMRLFGARQSRVKLPKTDLVKS